MKIKILSIGKLKEKYWVSASDEYIKRLSAYCELEIVELKESKFQASNTPALEIKAKDEEAASLLARVNPSDYVIALDVKSQKISSEKLASKIENLAIEGKSSIVLVIGGSLGIGDELLKRSDYKISLSDMTFTHQMARIILLEQLYRCFKINRGETYHK